MARMLDRFPSVVFPLLLIALLFSIAAPLAGRLADLPLTDHARNSHNGELWTAESIVFYMDSGSCKPFNYTCTEIDQTRFFCKDPKIAGNWIGLIIGITSGKIVTGYTGTAEYWMGDLSESGCMMGAG
jgi:hypothetical protein